MEQLPVLKCGDTVEIIAPASRLSSKRLEGIKGLLASWNLKYLIEENILGDDLLCANTDEMRLSLLRNALKRSETKAIICGAGGYGSMRLIPGLSKIIPPDTPKLFIGMSDTISLSLYLNQQWKWPTLHGTLAVDKFSNDSIAAIKSILFGEANYITFPGSPLNQLAKTKTTIESLVTGGNLSIVQTSLGTLWEINGKHRIILLEEVGERGYRVDRMLEHLQQANVFKEAAAILLGDFIGGNEPNGTSLIEPILNRFAQNCQIPVVRIGGVGHGYTNFPMPLGTKAQLQLGDEINLTVFR
jgi:muramoyltetrapeptide carboxypeptidase